MKKTLNKFLKFLGFNVVKAKRARAKRPAYRSHVQIEDADTRAVRESGRTHYVGDDCPGGHVPGPVTQPSSDNNITGPTS